MGTKTGISWTESTWNPWHGCLKVSPGCKFCYMYTAKKRYGQDPMIVQRSKTQFREPLKWKEPQLVFTCSWSDWFIEQADEWRDEAWDVIRQTPHLTYQILTKRPERIAAHLPKDWGDGWPNVWLGVSAENQKYADERIPKLLSVPAKIRFVSAEPLLGPITFRPKCATLDDMVHAMENGYASKPMELIGLDWVIVGGETGPERREFKQEWAEAIQKQCRVAGVAFYMKQMGGSNPKLAAAAIPEHLNIQQFPENLGGQRGRQG